MGERISIGLASRVGGAGLLFHRLFLGNKSLFKRSRKEGSIIHLNLLYCNEM
jgi:hypothetical protein